MTGKTLEGRGGEQVATVFKAGVDAVERVTDVQRQVEFGLGCPRLQKVQRQVAQHQRTVARRLRTPVEQHLE